MLWNEFLFLMATYSGNCINICDRFAKLVAFSPHWATFCKLSCLVNSDYLLHFFF